MWVRLTYADGSQFCFQTTLNPGILNRHNITLKEDHLVRLDKKYLVGTEMVYKQIAIDEVAVDILPQLSYTDADSEFLHQFM